jgi:hypothetical protein
MTIEQRLIEKLHDLPPNKKKEVLEFVESIKKSNGSKSPAAVSGDCGLT